MNESDEIIEFNNDDSAFRFNTKTEILHITGLTPKPARPIILQMIREKWFPKKMKSIWFSGDPVQLITGIHTTIYLTSKPPVKKSPDRTFTDIVKNK